MSWAALLAKSKGERIEFGPAKVVVYAKDPEIDDDKRRLLNVDHETVSSVTLPSYTKGCLVLDANAIIKGMDNFSSVADAFVTTSQVIGEIRDKSSKQLMERLPHELMVLDPSGDAIREVIHMAERTGDLGVLSRTDIRLCALALDCCKTGGVELHPIEPRPAEVNPRTGTAGDVNLVTDEVSEHDEDEEDEEEEEEGANEEEEAQPAEEEAPEGAKKAQMPGWGGGGWSDEDKGDDSEDGEWITPGNIHKMGADGTRQAGGVQAFSSGIACVTSDFAMQNTLMHLGVPIVGPNGMRIHELRLWMLRCTGCFTLVMDSTRQFCPSCGSGDTLRRVNYTVNSNGDRHLFINFRKHISTRGNIYTIPKPRGGKKGTNRTLVLREDQLAQVIRGTSGAKMKEREVMAAFGDDDDLAMFGEPVHKHKRNLQDPRQTSSYHRYNLNEKRKQRAARRK